MSQNNRRFPAFPVWNDFNRIAVTSPHLPDPSVSHIAARAAAQPWIEFHRPRSARDGRRFDWVVAFASNSSPSSYGSQMVVCQIKTIAQPEPIPSTRPLSSPGTDFHGSGSGRDPAFLSGWHGFIWSEVVRFATRGIAVADYDSWRIHDGNGNDARNHAVSVLSIGACCANTVAAARLIE